MKRRDLLRLAGAGAGAAALGLPPLGCSPPIALDPLGGAGGLPLPTAGRDRFSRVPNAFNHRVTRGTAATSLNVLEGQVPSDVAGHVLFQSISLLDTDAGFGGDSLLWRLDLDGPEPVIQSKLLETADYHMGRAFANTKHAFDSHGMTRIGPLGMQNQTNTALVQLDGNRLVATVDGGRGWEIDPATLRPVTPVGELTDYRPMLELSGLNQQICPLTITSAHPPYDPQTNEFYGIALSIVPIPGMVFREVLLWDGEGGIKRVPLSTPEGAPLLISQSAHQLCISRTHLMILDASATIEWGKLTEAPLSGAAGQFNVPRPDSHVWLIDRQELRDTKGGATARRTIIPRESGHMMMDYDAEPGTVVIHSAHTAALDFAEWVMPYDTHANSREAVRPELVSSAAPVGYDIGVVGRYVVDTTSGRILEQLAFANDWTWGTGGLTARNPLKSTSTMGDVFHANSGFMTDLAVHRVYRGFRNYPHRLVANSELPWEGVPTSLVRYDHDNNSVADGYFFAGDQLCWTPTFVPRGGSATGSTDGYVVAVVYSDQVTAESVGTELWIFDAANLAQGPITKLGRPDLEVPVTLHSVWLDSLHTSRPDYQVDVAGELTSRSQTWSFDPEVDATVKGEVVPAYEASVG